MEGLLKAERLFGADMNKLRILLLVLLCLAILEFVVIYAANPVYMQVNPEIQEVSHKGQTYTMQWDGGNATITLVTPAKTTTMNVINQQQFVCNGTTNIYLGNRLIFKLPP